MDLGLQLKMDWETFKPPEGLILKLESHPKINFRIWGNNNLNTNQLLGEWDIINLREMMVTLLLSI